MGDEGVYIFLYLAWGHIQILILICMDCRPSAGKFLYSTGFGNVFKRSFCNIIFSQSRKLQL